jgi:hypothetical protein
MKYKLTQEILKLSVSQNWDIAKNEWVFISAYRSDDSQVCLCGHNPIFNICVIKNKINEKSTEVGNCCINKFLDIDDANNIFDSIKRIKADITKSMSIGALEYLKSKNIINDYEYTFYGNIINKRKLSDKQIPIKKKINVKLLEFTNYSINSQIDKINMILEWSKNQPSFDVSFVISLKCNFERFGKLTENQKKALDNLITKLKLI